MLDNLNPSSYILHSLSWTISHLLSRIFSSSSCNIEYWANVPCSTLLSYLSVITSTKINQFGGAYLTVRPANLKRFALIKILLLYLNPELK